MVPRTRLAYFTLYLAGIAIVLILLRSLLAGAGASGTARALDGWITFVGWAFAILLLVLVLRWFRKHVMWSVRNRLIVTYLFIGGVPVALAVAMALGSGYLVLGDLATFIAVSEIKGQEQRLGAANAAAVEEITRHGNTAEKVAANDPSFPGRTVTFEAVSSLPSWLKDGFSGMVSDHGKIYLRAANSVPTSHGVAMVVSSVPFDQKLLARIASKLGSLTLSSVDFELNNNNVDAELENRTSQGHGNVRELLSSEHISAGSPGGPVLPFDREFVFGGPIQATDWATGSSRTKILGGQHGFPRCIRI